MPRARSLRAPVALAAAVAAVSGLATAALAGNTGDAVTISLSGSTAMRNFTTSAGFSLLNPGSSITLGPVGSERNYAATAGASTSVQLAAGDFSTATALPAVGAPATAVNTANYAALRIEWHEQGSVEGILELADGQINDGYISNLTYNPSEANPTWVNRNRFNGAGSATVTGTGPTVGSAATLGNYTLAAFNSANDRVTSQVQNRVQMAISDVNARQGFSTAGTANWARTPGQAGYGLGNTALAAGSSISGIGQAGRRQSLESATVLNMTQGAANPNGGTYAAGPWNNGGLDNLDNKTVAITATVFAANPGTGLERLNRTDAQFLQATGRLANGADFNVVTRDVNSGTRNVAALNVGLDPSFAVGELDAGTGAAAESNIGAGIRFSNKTSGGSALRPTVQNSRMALGHLSISDYKNSGGGADNGSRPLRALDYRDDADDVSNGSNGYGYFSNGVQQAGDAPTGQFARISYDAIRNGEYVIYQNQTYVTVKAPNAAFAGDTAAQWAARTDAETGIAGDNSGNDVRDVRDNILGAVANFPATSIANPADALRQQSFIIPQFMKVRKGQDGLNQSVAQAANPLSDTFASVYAPSFAVTAPASVTTGGTANNYGNATPSGGAIPITARNYLFGNFDGDADRDYADVKLAQNLQAQLAATGGGVAWNGAAGTNSAVIANGLTRGDLIALGDFDSNGTFDGRDLYLLARGASLADSTGVDTLGAASGANFGDQVRRGVLRKNAALDYMRTNATAQQKLDARVTTTFDGVAINNDPTGANAFDKFDVNRDGVDNIYDAKAVLLMQGKSIGSLDDQLGAVLTGTKLANLSTAGSRLLSLVDAELNDDTLINAADLALIKASVRGDFNLDGVFNNVDIAGFVQALTDEGGWLSGKADLVSADLPLIGDFNGDLAFNNLDIAGFVAALTSVAPLTAGDWAAFSVVPEPASVGSLAVGIGGLLTRRRRAGARG
jgi:hypothetical protein